jgi:putative nucleotidyltransferase with HDIG domain
MPDMTARPARPWALRLLPPFPAVASRVISLVTNDDVGARQVSEIVKLDPTFTAEILKVANSALFGVAREVKTVDLAVPLLGLDRVKAIATLIAVNSMVKSTMKVAAMRKSWQHSLVTAIITDEAARNAGAHLEAAYTAGLLHNLGALGLMAAYPEEYTRMLDVSSEEHFDLLHTEQELFEIDHCAAGAYLAQEWNFPDEIAAAIATHHDEPTKGEVSIYSLVQVSWRLADVLGYAAFPPDREWTYEELVDFIPGIKRSWLGAGPEAAQQEIAKRLTGFGL